jgi:ribonuclease HI
MADAGLLTIHTDGASRGNPGEAAYAYVLQREGEPPVEEAGRLGRMTNNQAEYTALARALEHALEVDPRARVVVHSDSELMVKQLNGEYRVKNADLLPLYELITKLCRRFAGGVTFRHVRRELNSRADELCNEALDGKRVPTRRAPAADAPPAGGASAPPAPAAPPPGPDLHGRAVACLRAAATAWARGSPDAPAPEEVWRQLSTLVRDHWMSLLAPPAQGAGDPGGAPGP